MTERLELTLGDDTTAESLAATLRAERGCWKTYLDYFDFVDTKQPPHMAAGCFTEDVVITYGMRGAPMEFKGRDAYAGFLAEAMPRHEMSAHLVAQHRFAWHEGIPRLLSRVNSWQWFAERAHEGESRPADFATIARAEDEFRCVDGYWLIARRFVQPAAGVAAVGAPT